MSDDINNLKIQVAVIKEAIDNLKGMRGEPRTMRVPSSPRSPIATKSIELPEYNTILESAQAPQAAAVAVP
jgi:hypothetical protein